MVCMANRTQQIALRVSPEERDQLLARARAEDVSLTAYIVGACLGTLPSQTEPRFADLEEQLAGMDRRLSQLEELAGR